MIGTLKHVARAVTPAPVRRAWGEVYGRMKIRRARTAFEQDAGGRPPAFLPIDELPGLMDRGYEPPHRIRYDLEGLAKRAVEKVQQLEDAGTLAGVRTSLELGCWDGMVVGALAARGVTALGLDMARRGVELRARAEGARFVQSDAGAIAVGSASIDLVYSFASFEHFPRPDLCMSEVHRVLRPGGCAFIHFGPLYFSPHGLHAYRQIPVPFCQLLFRDEDLHRWAAEHQLDDDWPFVNGWALKQYRDLWKSLDSQFEVTAYREHTTGGMGVELVNEYPGCFQGRVDSFEELLVAFVDITLRKR